MESALRSRPAQGHHATCEPGVAIFAIHVAGARDRLVGNISEIIIAGFLISAGEIEVVHASITGSIIDNLLLVLGVSLLVGGVKNGVPQYDAEVTGMNAASLILATIGLIVPATFAFLIGATPATEPGVPRPSSIFRRVRCRWR
jgi:calcium/proton exchanger cax